MSDTILVSKSAPWRARIRVPGDKSISHRAAIFAGLAEGVTRIAGFLASDDCLCTLAAMEAMGARVDRSESADPARPDILRVTGVAGNPQPPGEVIDCGNSGTAMRLLAGVLAARPFATTLTGDASLSGRPMGRIITPLERMGARLTGTGEKRTAPLRVEGGGLTPITYEMPVASAQVKSAVLLAGMGTAGETTVIQPETTRDHTERLAVHFGIEMSVRGNTISVTGPQTPKARDLVVPGDISSAAFWCVAAAACPGAELTLEGVGLNPTRTGVLDVLRRMGASIDIRPEGGADGEPFGTVTVCGGTLHGTLIGGPEIPNVIDEIPVLAVAGALAGGETIIRDAAELRVKESDRISEVVVRLRAMGADVAETPDGMIIRGGAALRGASVDSHGDHRIAMAFAVAGLFAEGATEICDTACIATSYPGFQSTLAAISAAASASIH